MLCRVGLLLLCVVACAIEATARRGLTQTWKEEFPPYNCEPDPALSPYKLESSYITSPSANGVRVCFTGAPVQRCPAGDACCSSTDFYKLELRVRPTCRHAIRSVTVNGVPAAVAPTFEVYGAGREKALYKMPQLNLTRYNVAGAKICLSLRDPCPNLAALCPEGDGSCTYAIVPSSSPIKCCPVNTLGSNKPKPSSPPSPAVVQRPPPPSPSPKVKRPPAPIPKTFPYHTCNTTRGLMPYTLSGAPSLTYTSKGNRLYCFGLASSSCSDPASPCCSAQLLKVEWWSHDTCRGSVRAAFIDKLQYPVTWDRGGTFRLTKLSYTSNDVAAKPRQLCVELRKDSPCETIDRFCRGGRCSFAVYDTSQECCPTSFVPLS